MGPRTWGTLLRRLRDIDIVQVIALSGLMESTGRRLVEGARVYFDYVNATGGVEGRRIRHVVHDDGHRVEDTIRITRDALAEPGTLALFGFGGTENISRLLSEGVLAQGGAPMVAPYTGGSPLREPFNPWIFHLRAGYADEAERIVHREFMRGRRRFALMVSADAMGRDGLVGVQAALARRDLRLVASGSFERNTEEIDRAAERVASARPDVVVMFSTNRTTAAFARKYRELQGSGLLYNVSLVHTAEVIALAGIAAVRDMVVTQVVPSPHMLSLPAAREYQTAMRRFAPGSFANYAGFEQFLGAKILVEGLRRAGSDLSRAHLIAALESIEDFDLGGITVDYSPTNRVGSRRVDFTVVKDDGSLQAAA